MTRAADAFGDGMHVWFRPPAVWKNDLPRRQPDDHRRDLPYNEAKTLLEVRKVMSERRRFSYNVADERQGLACGTGTSSPPCRATRLGGVLGGGGRRVLRRRSPLSAALGRRVSTGGWSGSGRPHRLGAATQVDPHPGEGHPPVAGRQADRARIPDRPVDRAEGGPHDPPGVRRRPQPEVLTVWLRRRGFTPQKPRRVPRQRDPEAIAAWLASDWPRIKKKPGGSTPTSP